VENLEGRGIYAVDGERVNARLLDTSDAQVLGRAAGVSRPVLTRSSLQEAKKKEPAGLHPPLADLHAVNALH
jgi:hypothetical protein